MLETAVEISRSYGNEFSYNAATDTIKRENKQIVELICDICPGPVIAVGRRPELINRGWEIGKFSAFCPAHLYES